MADISFWEDRKGGKLGLEERPSDNDKEGEAKHRRPSTGAFQLLLSLCGSGSFSVSIFTLSGFTHALSLKSIPTRFKKPGDLLTLPEGLPGSSGLTKAESLVPILEF